MGTIANSGLERKGERACGQILKGKEVNKMMIRRLRELWLDDSGISAIEYALLAAGIALVIAVGAGLLGNAVNDKFNNVAANINGTE